MGFEVDEGVGIEVKVMVEGRVTIERMLSGGAVAVVEVESRFEEARVITDDELAVVMLLIEDVAARLVEVRVGNVEDIVDIAVDRIVKVVEGVMMIVEFMAMLLVALPVLLLIGTPVPEDGGKGRTVTVILGNG